MCAYKGHGNEETSKYGDLEKREVCFSFMLIECPPGRQLAGIWVVHCYWNSHTHSL